MSTVVEATRTVERPVSRGRWLRRTPLGRFITKLPFWLLIAAIFVYAIFPFYWAIRSAFTPESELFRTPVDYFPKHPTLSNFRDALSTSVFQHALINSTIGALYTLITDFHFYDRLAALIFSYMIFTLPFTVWVLTSFMRGLPGDLEEAAYVDGATPLQVFYKVLLPLIAPGLVTTGLLAFIAAWNEYLYALSFIQTPNKYTVTLAITTFQGKSGFQQPWGQIMAATVIVTLPLIVATLVLQRRILAGLTAGAVKG